MAKMIIIIIIIITTTTTTTITTINKMAPRGLLKEGEFVETNLALGWLIKF